jgi:hypothetical protein
MEPLALVLGAGGFALGLAADRLATRWLEHDEEHAPGRPADWRTAIVALVGALAFGLLPLRFGGDPLAFAIFGAWFATLVVGLATDLDQRLLPDRLTLPVIPVALVYALSGANPSSGARSFPLVAAATIGRPVPAVHPFGAGAFGLGDVKLLVGVGLLAAAAVRWSVIFALALAGSSSSSCCSRAGSDGRRTSRSGRSSSSGRSGRYSSGRDQGPSRTQDHRPGRQGPPG